MVFPFEIKFNVTNNCNLRCKHCFIKDYSKTYIDFNKFKNLVDYFYQKKIYSIILTGGEPLLHKDIIDMINYVKSKGLYCALATNGTLIMDEHIKEFKKNKIDMIQISIENSNEKINNFIRGKGVFNKALKSIKLLSNNNIYVVASYTINHFNKDNLDLFVRKCKELNAYPRFELFLPITNNSINNKLKLKKEDLKCIKIQFKEINKKYKDTIFPITTKQGCGAGIYSVVINSDFTLSPCDLLAEKIKTKDSVNPENFVDVLNNDNNLKIWRNINNKVDNVKCRAAAYCYKGNIYGKDEISLVQGDLF